MSEPGWVPPPQPPPRRRWLITLMAGAVVIAVGVGAVILLSGDEKKVTITGSVLLKDPQPTQAEEFECSGDGGFSDLRQGAQVSVRDEANRVLGVSTLGPGHTQRAQGLVYYCRFYFAVSELPRAEFYAVEVSGWEIDLELGS